MKRIDLESHDSWEVKNQQELLPISIEVLERGLEILPAWFVFIPPTAFSDGCHCVRTSTVSLLQIVI
jgi:hypothetical protein